MSFSEEKSELNCVDFQDFFNQEEILDEDISLYGNEEMQNDVSSTLFEINEDNNNITIPNTIDYQYALTFSDDFDKNDKIFDYNKQENISCNLSLGISKSSCILKDHSLHPYEHGSFSACNSKSVNLNSDPYLNFPPQFICATNYKAIYGRGPEVRNMEMNYIHYKEPFDKCKIYIGFKMPNFDFFKKLGKDYNRHFYQMIKNKSLPKFKRDHARNLGLAVWFFEDIFQFIEPWLISAKNFKI